MKTSELEGIALDWAVAWANGNITIKNFSGVFYLLDGDVWNPSTDWAQGGPIIEREKITLDFDHNGPDVLWGARHFASDGTMLQCEYADTPLIAAMRCYVASRLGDEVELPEELK